MMLGDAVGGEYFFVLLGGEKSRDQHIDADFLRRPFAGEVDGEVVHGTLSRNR